MKRNDLLRLARLAVQLARTQLQDYASQFAPKRYGQPSLLACLCLKEFLHMDYRSCEACRSAQERREVLRCTRSRTIPRGGGSVATRSSLTCWSAC